MSETVIEMRRVTKQFHTPAGEFTALCDVDLRVDRGELAVVAGASGSGKSTLLGMLAGIDRPTRGEVIVGGTAVQALRERDLSAWRGRTVGIVFQFFQLLPTLTAAENVMLPMDFCGAWPVRQRRPRATALLDRLGVADQADKLPATLSGGQQQRVALARALANDPAVLLADEPTGNLDSKTAAEILRLMTDLAGGGQTVVMVTHDRAAMSCAARRIELADGRLVGAAAMGEGPSHA